VAWIWLCHLQLERKLLEPVGLAKYLGLGDRPAFNPLEKLAGTPAWAYTFLAIRFVGLALIVPIIEEFFLRGFVMRFVIRDDWWDVPFGTLTPIAAVVGTAVPMLMHPGELIAAFVWFSLVTWLMARTRNIWDCVAAHAVTNLLLGIYVVTQHQWQLW
jgi:CAAX prenyl protease-like protein